MTEIKRYGSGLSGQIIETKQGSFVDYDDHAAIVAALQEQLFRYSMSAGQADQRRAESVAVRTALGFGGDADDVSPKDLVDAITALHEQVRTLAAENVLVREQSEEVYAAGYNHGHLNTADGIAYAPGTKDDFYPNALQVMAEVETPATDATLREIRAQAVGDSDDKKRMDWLCSHVVEVRQSLPYGSHKMFYAECDSDDCEEYHSMLREQVDAAIRAGEQP